MLVKGASECNTRVSVAKAPKTFDFEKKPRYFVSYRKYKNFINLALWVTIDGTDVYVCTNSCDD